MEFRVLGPLEAVEAGRALPLGGPKQRALLALLLLHPNEVVSTDRLIDEVWGARPPKSVDASLQNCVSHLRTVLGREVIETRPPGYRLNVDAGSVDALRFEQALAAAQDLDPPERASALREALALWRGRPLAGVEFEGFAGAELSRLDELRLAALEQRIEAELELGRHDALLPELEALAARHPARERLRYLQMLALYRAGRQRDALRVYQEARLELVNEFGLEPSERLRVLERLIIEHSPALRLASEPALVGAPRAARRRNVVILMLEVVDLEGARPAARSAAAAALTEIAMIVGRHGGSVRQLAPEELIAEFAAHDDDALRALRAAFEARTAAPAGFVVRTAVERVAEDGDLDAVRRLLTKAATGELLLGPGVLRLVPAAVDVVPHESGEGFRVLRFDPKAEPFARRLEAPLVGRVSELEALESALHAAARTRSPRKIVLVGDAGIGKTRLAREFAALVRSEAQVLTGRCAPYGDEAAVLPLLEILEQLGPADAVIARMREQLSSEPSEAFWAVRRLLEESAGGEPLVLVFEDVHWAAPTLLDLADYLAGWSTAPLLVLCVARPELLESRPEWRDDALVLDALSSGEAERLAAALPESSQLDGDTLAAAVGAAEGNPLFLEQLVSFAAEEAQGSTPPTLEVLLASRVDRLLENERAVLERASVAGRHFWRSTVEEASPEDERAAVGSALMALVRRRLVHPERALLPGEDGFRFHHALIRDAVYAGIPETARAVLHESVARSLEGRNPELDETVGYHLEQAALLDPDLRLAHEAAERLGAAGMRALRRVDARCAIDLLTRALALESTLERECALGTAYKFAGDLVRAEALLDDVVRKSKLSGDGRIEHLAAVELVWPRLAGGDLALDDVLALLERAKPVFEQAGDDFALGRAWHLTAAVKGVYELRYGEFVHAATRCRRHYERSGFAAGSVVVLFAVAAYRGPTPVRSAIRRCRALLADAGTPVWASFVLPPLAALEAMAGRFDAARRHLEDARLGRREFADTGTLATNWTAIAAEVELLAGNPQRAEQLLAAACDALRAAGETEWLATNTALLGEALYRQERFEDALAAGESALAIAPPGHLTSTAVGRRVRAKALARVGRLDEAEALAREAIELLANGDVLDEQGEAFAAAAEVQLLAGASAEADEYRQQALALFEQKGNVVSADRVRTRVAVPR